MAVLGCQRSQSPSPRPNCQMSLCGAAANQRASKALKWQPRIPTRHRLGNASHPMPLLAQPQCGSCWVQPGARVPPISLSQSRASTPAVPLPLLTFGLGRKNRSILFTSTLGNTINHTDHEKPELSQQNLGKHNVPSALCAGGQPQRARPKASWAPSKPC